MYIGIQSHLQICFLLPASMIMIPAAAYAANTRAQEAFLICLRDYQDPILSCLIPFIWYEPDPNIQFSLKSQKRLSPRSHR